MPALSIVVVNYASSALLRENLVRTQNGLASDCVVVVVDNHTDSRERARLRVLAEANGWTLVEPSRNLGFGAGVNLGVRRARELGANVHLLLNPDAWMDAESVRALRDTVSGHDPMVAAPRIVRSDGTLWAESSVVDLANGETHSRRWAQRHPTVTTREWLSGAALAVNDAAWAATGGFDEDYFLYWEDVDFSFRAAAAGSELVYVAEATAVHDEGGTHSDGGDARAKSATYYRYNIRNRILFATKWLDSSHVAAWDRTTLPAAREILLRGGRRQLLRPWRWAGAVVRGVREARAIARSSRNAQDPRAQ